MGWERESGDRQLEWGGKGRVVIDRRRSGVGGESGDRQLEWGGKGRVGIDRRRSGVGGGEW